MQTRRTENGDGASENAEQNGKITQSECGDDNNFPAYLFILL